MKDSGGETVEAGARITGKSQVYCIIGDPVSHSLSPLFQNRFLHSAAIDGVYVPFRVPQSNLEVALAGMWALGVQGANVTVPHKESVFRLVAADDAARRIGAVNTLRRGEGGWIGSNSDWLGLRNVLSWLGVKAGGTLLLMGAGGTARAAMEAAAALGLRRVLLANRGHERLQSVIADAATAWPTLSVEPVAWEAAAVLSASREAEAIVNTTTIGLTGGTGSAEAEYPFRFAGYGVGMDAVYSPDGDTPFCQSMRACGRKSVDGLPMLIGQGAESFAMWHDRRPDWLETLGWMRQQLGREVPDVDGRSGRT